MDIGSEGVGRDAGEDADDHQADASESEEPEDEVDPGGEDESGFESFALFVEAEESLAEFLFADAEVGIVLEFVEPEAGLLETGGGVGDAELVELLLEFGFPAFDEGLSSVEGALSAVAAGEGGLEGTGELGELEMGLRGGVQQVEAATGPAGSHAGELVVEEFGESIDFDGLSGDAVVDIGDPLLPFEEAGDGGGAGEQGTVEAAGLEFLAGLLGELAEVVPGSGEVLERGFQIGEAFNTIIREGIDDGDGFEFFLGVAGASPGGEDRLQEAVAPELFLES